MYVIIDLTLVFNYREENRFFDLRFLLHVKKLTVLLAVLFLFLCVSYLTSVMCSYGFVLTLFVSLEILGYDSGFLGSK